MQTNHKTPVKIVMRSRFRSTTEEEPSDDDIPPPNMSESPPPLPLCSSTSSTMSRLEMIRTIENAMTTAGVVPPGALIKQVRQSHDTGRSLRIPRNRGSHHR